MKKTLAQLPSPLITSSFLRSLVQAALREDGAFDDITTLSVVPKNLKARAILLAKQDLVVCGMPLVKEAFRQLDPQSKIKVQIQEGKFAKAGNTIATIQGKARALLSAERVALNFLQHLSGIATLTQQFCQQLRGTKAKILDTRKTIPGLRLCERYAVKIGGGTNHRFNLKSAILIKDNHLEIAGSIHEALKRIPKQFKKNLIIVEVKNLSEFREALQQQVTHILLDNMSLSEMKQAVALRNAVRRKALTLLEASGGVNLKRVRAIAKTGVDYISAGALTHSAKAADISLEIVG